MDSTDKIQAAERPSGSARDDRAKPATNTQETSAPKGKMIYLHDIEYKIKKGKSFINKQTQIVSVCKTAMEMNNTSRVISILKGEAFGIKSAAYKSQERNLWVTKIVSSTPISRSFYYVED